MDIRFGNSVFGNSPSLPTQVSGWDNGLAGIKPQKELLQGQAFTGITFQGGGNLPLVHNTGNVSPAAENAVRTPKLHAVQPTDGNHFTNSSPIGYVNAKNFNDVFGGGGPRNGNVNFSALEAG